MEVYFIVGVCVSGEEYAKVYYASRGVQWKGRFIDEVTKWRNRPVETPTLVTNLVLYTVPHDITEESEIVIGLPITVVPMTPGIEGEYRYYHGLPRLTDYIDKFKEELISIRSVEPRLAQLLASSVPRLYILRSECLCCY